MLRTQPTNPTLDRLGDLRPRIDVLLVEGSGALSLHDREAFRHVVLLDIPLVGVDPSSGPCLPTLGASPLWTGQETFRNSSLVANVSYRACRYCNALGSAFRSDRQHPTTRGWSRPCSD